MHSPFTTAVTSVASAMTTTTPSLYPPLSQVMTTAGAAITESLRTVTVVTNALAGVHMTSKSTSWGSATAANAAATSRTVLSNSTASKGEDWITEKAKVLTFDTDETRFVNAIDMAVEILSNLRDADETTDGSSGVVQIFSDLMQTYGHDKVQSMMAHVKDGDKFSRERSSWREQLKWNGRRLRDVELRVAGTTLNLDRDIERTVDRVHMYLRHCLERDAEDRQSACDNILGSDLGSVTAQLHSMHQNVVEETDPWAEYSLVNEETVKADLNGTPRIDPDPGKNFRKLAEKGPPRARARFQKEMKRLAKPVRMFKNAKDNININLDSYGEFAEIKQLQKFFASLTLAYFTICSLRASAISLFSKNDQDQDDYLNQYSQCLSRVKKKIFTVFPKLKIKEDPE